MSERKRKYIRFSSEEVETARALYHEGVPVGKIHIDLFPNRSFKAVEKMVIGRSYRSLPPAPNSTKLTEESTTNESVMSRNINKAKLIIQDRIATICQNYGVEAEIEWDNPTQKLSLKFYRMERTEVR